MGYITPAMGYYPRNRYIYIYICMCICIYIIYIYIHLHIYIYVYVYYLFVICLWYVYGYKMSFRHFEHSYSSNFTGKPKTLRNSWYRKRLILIIHCETKIVLNITFFLTNRSCKMWCLKRPQIRPCSCY